MKTSDAGIYALALHEGIVPAPYKDSVGVWTYGIGHTAAAGGPDPAKMAKGMPQNLDAALADVFDVFRADLPKYEAGVNRALKVPVTQAQFDALVSFHYNTGAIGRASFVKKLNAGDVAGAAVGIMAWNKPPEIIGRRKEEQKLFAKGIYPTGKVNVWRVDGSGRVIWKAARTLSMPEVMAMLGKPIVDQPLASKPVDVKETPKSEHQAPVVSKKPPVSDTTPPAVSKAPGLIARIIAALIAMFRRN